MPWLDSSPPRTRVLGGVCRTPLTVLVTGNLGYIGPVLTEVLEARSHRVVGLDTDYYQGCELTQMPVVRRQIRKDVRDASPEDLAGIDAVVHLAALSNDPLGELEPELTADINCHASVMLAKLAKAAGVRRFVYISSQSMYGISSSSEELDEDGSEKNPLTAYAAAKWDAEQALNQLNDANFTVVSLRPSTVFGVSPRLRCDIVFNNLVACAYTTGRIEIRSDGTPWRPVVHVRDVSSAILAGLEAPASLVAGKAFNVGIPDGNFSVRQLAESAQRAVPGCDLVFTGEHGSDARTYRVSFHKILTVLADYYRPEYDLDRGGAELVQFFRDVQFTKEQFRGRTCVRLQQIEYLMRVHWLDTRLRWLAAPVTAAPRA